MEKAFVATNHLTAKTSTLWIAAIMGGHFHNSARCDLPTRRTRIYFNVMDDFEIREDAQDPEGHILVISGFDNPNARGTNHGYDRLTYRNLFGYRVDDLDSFSWRATYQNTRVEISATRVGNSDIWIVDYKSDGRDTENDAVLASWFQMIDPESLNVHKLTAVIAVLNVAGAASQMACNDAIYRGNHPQMYKQLAKLATERGVDPRNCWGASMINDEVPMPAALASWWLKVMDLPLEEEMPSYRDDEAHHAWRLRHADIMFALYKELLPRYFRDGSCFATEEVIVDELVTIGQAVHDALGEPPEFSFKEYLFGVNWEPATLDSARTDRVLAAASERLGWQMT